MACSPPATRTEAEAWAFNQIAKEFRLNAAVYENLQDIWGDTDGGRLFPLGDLLRPVTAADPAST